MGHRTPPISLSPPHQFSVNATKLLHAGSLWVSFSSWDFMRTQDEPGECKTRIHRLSGEIWSFSSCGMGLRQSYLGFKCWGGTQGSPSYRDGRESVG